MHVISHHRAFTHQQTITYLLCDLDFAGLSSSNIHSLATANSKVLKQKQTMCSISLGGSNLAHIVSGEKLGNALLFVFQSTGSFDLHR